jgi:ABC-type sugar transport system ATPase subunit
MGENGAGKSTLGKILAGIYAPDSGAILLEGKEVHSPNPLAARRNGIAMVHQELAFCPNLSVAENLCLGDFPRSAGFVRREEMRQRALQMLQSIGADIDPDVPIESLSTGQEQLVQIAAAVGSNARVIVMDEPTSSLSLKESENLFRLLADLKRRQITVIYVSHRMEEIFRLCDTITVLRDGRHINTQPASETNHDALIQQMIGRDLVSHSPQHLQQTPGEEMLRVENLTSPGRFQEVSLSLRKGEILGLAGLVGAGRSEVAQAIFGIDQRATGKLLVRDVPVALGSVERSMRAGIGYLPEDRKRQGLVLSMSCRENSSLASLRRLSRLGFVNRSAERKMVSDYANRLRVKTPGLDAPVAGLSGGNQQKIALIKWLARNCEILIVDEPTRGVDVGAKAEIHQLLDELACAGLAILLISSELPEIMNLSRRIQVMKAGVLTGELQREQFSQEALMRLMAGLQVAEVR